MTKPELRREMRQRLRELGPARAALSRALVAHLLAHPALASADCVGVFAPLPGEPDIELLWEKRARGFCYPRVGHGGMDFLEVRALGELAPAPWNAALREPALTADRLVTPADLDVILVPGLAFTRDGHRLGRGGGYYDRFLARLPAATVKIGVCFDRQLAATLPAEPHDHPMDAVVTESGLFTPTPPARATGSAGCA